MDLSQARVLPPSNGASCKRIYIPAAAYVTPHLLTPLPKGGKSVRPADAWNLLRSRECKLKSNTKFLSIYYWLRWINTHDTMVE